MVSQIIGLVAIGGLLHYVDGKFRGGFMAKIGTCSISQAKAWALVDVLEMAWEV